MDLHVVLGCSTHSPAPPDRNNGPRKRKRPTGAKRAPSPPPAPPAPPHDVKPTAIETMTRALDRVHGLLSTEQQLSKRFGERCKRLRNERDEARAALAAEQARTERALKGQAEAEAATNAARRAADEARRAAAEARAAARPAKGGSASKGGATSPQAATAQAVRRKLKQLARALHPDKNTTIDPTAATAMLNEVMELL